MNIKKTILIIIVILIIIAGGVYLYIINKEPEYEEYVPQEEISQEQERQTMVSLYFINKNTRNVEPEARLIDVKELIQEPYTTIINLLIEGPKNENHEKTIAEGTRLIGVKIESETVILDFSEEFINNHKGGKEEEENTINSIVKTLTELTEVNAVKILVNGEENKQFSDGEVKFTQDFVRID